MEYDNHSKEELINELIQLKKCNNELENHLKQTEIELKLSEEKFRSWLKQEVNKLQENNDILNKKVTDKYLKLFNSIDQGFFVMDVIFDENDKPVDIYYVEANEASIKILGSDYSNKYLKDIIPNYESNWLEMYGEAAFTGKSVRMELYAETNKRWYSFYLFKIGDENSSTIGNIFSDITERKMLEEALKESEEKLRTILENSRDGITMFDLRTKKYLYMSPSQEQLYGFTMEEINNFSAEIAYVRVHPDDYEICKEQHKMVATGIKTSVEVQYRWKVKNGEYRWFGDMRKVVYDENGQPIAIVGVSRDITNQMEYEEKLALQAKILSNVNDAIIVVDENDRIIYCNDSLVKLLGWQEQEFIDRPFSFFVQGYLDEVSKEKVLLESEEIQKANSTVDEDFLNGIKCYSKNGTQIIADINRTIVRGPKGEFKGFIAALRDVSENYEYQIQLKKSEEKYRYLFNSIDEGLAIIEVIFKNENKP
jgi:PAS domain S-box-containing protein